MKTGNQVWAMCGSAVDSVPGRSLLQRARRRGELQRQQFDAEYLAALREREPATERHFADYFGTMMQRKLGGRVKCRELVEDVRQETFARVLWTVRSPAGVRDPHSLGAFVNTVCNNVLYELVRRKRRSECSTQRADCEDHPSPDRDPEGSLIGKETVALVHRVLRALPPREEAVLRALVVHELERDEVCEHLGIDRAYLRVLLHRARKAFRTLSEDLDHRRHRAVTSVQS